MKRLTAFEHGWLSVGAGADLSQAQADALAGAAAWLPPGALQWGYRRVKFAHFCGVVRIDDLLIEILPKLYPTQSPAQQRGLLLTLLRIAGELDSLPGQPADLDSGAEHLLDVFVRHFVHLLERQLRQGMLSGYREREENLTRVRGRIQLAAQLRDNLTRPHRLACHYAEFSGDIAVNRLLRSAVDLLDSLVATPDLRQRLRALAVRFAAIAPLTPAERHHLDRLTLNRMEQRYAPVVRLAKLFLEGQLLNVRSGAHTAISLLFNMNLLFERCVAKRLRPQIAAQGWRLVEQGPRRYLGYDRDDRNWLLMRPDIAVLDPQGRVLRILDTKWKVLDVQKAPLASVSAADLYQMVSYARTYGCPEVCLIYPAQPGLAPGSQVTLQCREGTRVSLSGFGFSRG